MPKTWTADILDFKFMLGIKKDTLKPIKLPMRTC